MASEDRAAQDQGHCGHCRGRAGRPENATRRMVERSGVRYAGLAGMRGSPLFQRAIPKEESSAHGTRPEHDQVWPLAPARSTGGPYAAAFVIRIEGSFTERTAAASASIAKGRSKLLRQARATLRDGMGAANGTTRSSFVA